MVTAARLAHVREWLDISTGTCGSGHKEKVSVFFIRSRYSDRESNFIENVLSMGVLLTRGGSQQYHALRRGNVNNSTDGAHSHTSASASDAGTCAENNAESVSISVFQGEIRRTISFGILAGGGGVCRLKARTD
jgi:hypothetical protein